MFETARKMCVKSCVKKQGIIKKGNNQVGIDFDMVYHLFKEWVTKPFFS